MEWIKTSAFLHEYIYVHFLIYINAKFGFDD
jgi:hypothetical protein